MTTPHVWHPSILLWVTQSISHLCICHYTYSVCACHTFHEISTKIGGLPLRFIVCVYMSALYACMTLHQKRIRSRCRWLWATMWLLGLELRSSGRAACTLNHWAISPAPVGLLLSLKHFIVMALYQIHLLKIFPSRWWLISSLSWQYLSWKKEYLALLKCSLWIPLSMFVPSVL